MSGRRRRIGIGIAGAALSAGLALVLGAALAAPPPAGPTPTRSAAGSSLAAGVAIRFPASEGVVLSGEWFAGPPHSPSVVLAPRRRGSEPDLRDVAREFQRRGYGALVFSLRDPAPVSREQDSLRYVVLASRWVEDMVGALQAARIHGDSTRPILAWGQGLGAAIAVAAAARTHGMCDAVAAEDIFSSVELVMRRRGIITIPDAIDVTRRLLKMRDDPQSAANRLDIPVFAILVGPGAGGPDDEAQKILRQNTSRTDRWLRPGVTSPAPTPTAAQVDTLATWFRQWGKAETRRILRGDRGRTELPPRRR